jgi:aspartyl-tRNA(Asn)/glutamyl-tRNA(Gln) amidotransferase subunit B
LEVTEEMIDQIQSTMPPLPSTLRDMWKSNYGLSDYDVALLTQTKSTADFFIELLSLIGIDLVKPAANIIAGEMASALNREGIEVSASPIRPVHIAEMLLRIQDGTISNKIAKDIFSTLWERGLNTLLPDNGVVDALIEEKGLKQISDAGAIEKLIDQVLAENQKSVEEYRSGKEKAFNSLIGQIMKASKGKANPAQVNQILKDKLNS